MNYDKIKALEESIILAIKAHDCDPKQAIEFVEKCFSAKRVENLMENQIKGLKSWNEDLEKEITRHKTCIDHLRGYVYYLEKEKSILEDKLDQK